MRYTSINFNMPEIIVLQQRISKYLNNIEDLIQMQNASGDYSLNKVAENIFKNILNIVYDFKLDNTNLYIANYPSIDLASTNGSRICFQVTSTNDVSKIKSTIKTFLKNELSKDFDKLKFILLKPSKDYKTKKFIASIDRLLQQYNHGNFSFDITQDILDKNRLYNIVVTICNPEQLFKIHGLLQQCFDGYRSETSFSKYHEELKDSFHELVFDDEKGMTLNDIYIDPDFECYINTISEEYFSTPPEERADEFQTIDVPTTEIINSILSSNNDKLKNVFKNAAARVTFILGFPGQGKTSFCKKIIHNHLSTNPNSPIFYLKLRNVRKTKDLIENPLNIIHEELEIEVGDTFSKNILKKSIIILDGLDEIYMKDNLKAEDIEYFCKELIREAERLNYNKIIITSRYGYVDLKKLYDKDYLAFSLKPLNFSQQEEWLEKYSLFHSDSLLTKERLKVFNTGRHEYNYIKELINQPLLLYIVASLHVELDTNIDRAEIYNLLFDQIIDRKYSKDGQIDILRNLTKSDLRSLLNEVAYLIFCSGKEYITAEDLLSDNTIKEYISKIGNNNLAGTLKGVLISFYFKESKVISNSNEPSNTGIEFFHKSLQEYLAAEKIADSCFYDMLAKDSRNKYVLKYDIDILKHLNLLLGKQYLTNEICSYVKSIIQKESFEQRVLVGNRFIEHLNFLFEHDFLYEKTPSHHNPIDTIFKIFQSYWFLLQSLNLNQNYLSSSLIMRKFIQFFNAISAMAIPSYGLNISHQKFHDGQLNFFENLEDDIISTEFLSNVISNLSIAVDLKDVIFKGCSFYNISIDNSDNENVTFIKCSFFKFEFYVISLNNIIFKECNISDFSPLFYSKMKMKAKSIIFDKSVLDQDSYDILSKAPFKAVFRKCKISTDKNELIDITS